MEHKETGFVSAMPVTPLTCRSLPTPSPDEAFAAKHMPDLGQDVKEFRVFHWKLQGWKKLERRLTSREFDYGGHRWRILLFPFGSHQAPPNDTLSVYLDCAGPKNVEKDWHAYTQFALVISNPHDPTVSTFSHAYHRFTAQDPDWGFALFSELRQLFHPRPVNDRITIEDDSAVVSGVVGDPTGVLWNNFLGYDSKKETGYVGLKNQGTTSYINSLLQSLFCISRFRKAVYQIPTEDETPSESVPLELQRVFYHLQTSDKLVDTTELTKSFGLESLTSCRQHDDQEFNRLLQDALESGAKGTHAGGAVPKLFVGKLRSFIKCINVDCKSSRTDEFDDIQLNVKGMKTLHESFRDYVAVETLDGENKYRAEGFGLQGARKGITFQYLPPVLRLQLKRYEYDMKNDAMVKINGRFESPFEIDLDEFLDETVDRTEPWKYKLHSVLVHSGDMHGGHYFVLVKPDQYARWLKFDDDRVTPVTDREVLEENYGGEPPNGVVPGTHWNQVEVVERSTSAYVLVYIRETAADEVPAPLAAEDVPLHLRQRLDEECAHMETRQKK